MLYVVLIEMIYAEYKYFTISSIFGSKICHFAQDIKGSMEITVKLFFTGVSGAILRAAGQAVVNECTKLGMWL